MSSVDGTNCAIRLKIFREHLGMTQSEVSEAYGGAKKTISSYETGQREPNTEYLIWLSEKGMNIHWYYTGMGEMLMKNDHQQNHIKPIYYDELEVITSVFGILKEESAEYQSNDVKLKKTRIKLLEWLLNDAKKSLEK